MAKSVAKSASRALSLSIVKSKIHCGFQHNIFSKLYDTMDPVFGELETSRALMLSKIGL